MKLEGEYIFDGPREEVWELVRDPDALSSALPGAQNFEQVGENEYEGEMNVRVGPVAGLFSGRILISDEEPPESCTLRVEGKGKPGFINGTGHVNLVEQEDGATLMKYDADVQVGGRLASVGQRMLDTTSKSIIRQGLDSLNMLLQARMAAEEEGGEIEYKPPSEAEFAAGVARDVAQEMLTSPWVVLVALTAVVTLVILLVKKLNQQETEP